MSKAALNKEGQIVGNQNLLEQGQAISGQCRHQKRHAELRHSEKLRHEVLIALNWSGNLRGEEGSEERKAGKDLTGCPPRYKHPLCNE
jgi:hypothetical protein